MLKRTPLFAAHQKLGGKLVEFGGWEMPVQYTSILDEHQAVRAAAGLFDISHMGEARAGGPKAQDFLNHVLTNDLCKAPAGRGQYTLMCNERGGVVDDLYAYHLGTNDFLLVINASQIDDDIAWLQKQQATFAGRDEVELENASDKFGAVAVQGPCVAQFIDKCFSCSAGSALRATTAGGLEKNEINSFSFEGRTIFVARTGYTGEDGFEVVAPAEVMEAVWNNILEVGRPFGLKPCGLGARDTLRTEMCYPLYGHELDENTTPIEAGLGFFVALDKGEFIGRSALAEQKAVGTRKKLVAFKMTDKSAPPRPHYPIWADGAKVGEVVSGTQSP